MRGAGWASLWVIALGCAVWAFGALHYGFPVLKSAVAWMFAIGLLSAVGLLPGARRKLGAVFVACAVVCLWWLTLKPSNEGQWQADVAQLGWAETNDEVVTLYNVRNCDYRTETDYTPRWETRTVRLSQITGVDLAINY